MSVRCACVLRLYRFDLGLDPGSPFHLESDVETVDRSPAHFHAFMHDGSWV